jgi:hypothetical protein
MSRSLAIFQLGARLALVLAGLSSTTALAEVPAPPVSAKPAAAPVAAAAPSPEAPAVAPAAPLAAPVAAAPVAAPPIAAAPVAPVIAVTAPPAHKLSPPPPPPAVADATPSPSGDGARPRPGRSHHILGLAIDGGVPDGASATVLYRPWKFLRFGGGLLYNYIGYGVRGGVSVLPYFPIAPSLTLEAGHYFEANANARIAQFGKVPQELQPLLDRVSYTFANAQLGLEVGHPDWFVFYVRAGLSRVWFTPHGMDQVAASQASSGNTRVTVQDPNVRLGIPNVKAGFMIFFY